MVNRAPGGWQQLLPPQRCLFCGLPSGRPLPLCRPCEEELTDNRVCCYQCALPLPSPAPGTTLCGACQRRAPPFDRVLAPLVYEEAVAFLVQRWKFERQRSLGNLLARLWLDRIPGLPQLDLLVPVPLHWRRLLWRGFNQAEQLARLLRAESPALQHVALDNGLLRRVRAGPHQSRLGARQRLTNLADTFTIKRGCDSLRIALVDDVMTTGTTAAALAAILKQAGAHRVEVWCLARTPTPWG